MTLEEVLEAYIKECEEKSNIYSRRAELRAAAGHAEIAQSFGDWAFIYSAVAMRLRQILRKNKRGGKLGDGLAQQEN